jgi:hypothetical protein
MWWLGRGSFFQTINHTGERMNGKNPRTAACKAMADAQRTFTAACEHADRILDARLNQAALEVTRSASAVASLESELEQQRRAAATRLDIASAVGHHRQTVDRAKVLQRQAWDDYLTAVSAAVTKMATANVAS